MKIESGRNIGAPSGARRSDGSAPSGFSPNAGAPAKAAASAPVSAPPALDAILALQAEGMGGERRARQVKRGRAGLDALEDLARGLALGWAPGGLIALLEDARRGVEATGETGLDDLLREIDTRLAVELAKLERLAR
jgi:hypothetical protein